MIGDGIKNAIITKTQIAFEDHGILTIFLDLDYGDCSHQGFGGYSLRKLKSTDKKDSTGFFIAKIMEVAGVSDWKDVAGKTIRVAVENGFVLAVGHIVKDIWFCPKKDLEEGGGV